MRPTANNRDKGVNDLSSALMRRFNAVVLPTPATLEEEVLEGGDGGVLPDRIQSLAHEQITRGVVGDGERITVLTVAEFELALEVGAPQLVGFEGLVKGRSLRPMAPRLAALDQPMAIEHRVNG